jgi:hypothetical protein
MNIKNLKITSVLFVLFLIGCANTSQTNSQNNNIPKSCLSTYQYYSSKNICDVYWDNKNPQCDSDLRILLRDRGQSATPRSICGQPIARPSASTSSCNLTNIRQITPTNLCNTYYSTSNCNSEITSELNRRNLKSAPKDACGTNNNLNLNFPIIKLTSDNKQCEVYLNEIFLDRTPIKTACSERYKSIRDETILCRQELNTFIAANSVGVGKNFETCGLPIPTTPIFSSEVKINSYREIKSFTPQSISNYLSQFNESKRNICLRLHQNNDFDGSFCLYVLDREKKEADSSYKYLGKAIELSHPLALMRPYEIFKNVKEQKEKELIFNYLIQSAQLGNVSAAIDLGWIYIDKNPKNFQKGLFWSEFAANAGHGEGASNMGLIYHKGLGVKVDFEVAKYWYQRSLTMERYWSGQSHVGLGILYMNGNGVTKDINEAKRLFKIVINEMPRASKDNINQAVINLKKIGG